jgi:hypothetical protein
VDKRDDETNNRPTHSEPAATDSGIVTLYAHRLAAFRRRGPIRAPETPRVIVFGRAASPLGDRESEASDR